MNQVRSNPMPSLSSPVTRCGLLSGVVFYLHALVPGSRSYPFVWPLLGGVLVVILMWRHGEWLPVARALGAGARVGVIAAIVAFVLVVPTIAFIMKEAALPQLLVINQPQRSTVVNLSAAAVAGVGVACLLVIPVSTLGAVVAWPFLRSSRRVQAP